MKTVEELKVYKREWAKKKAEEDRLTGKHGYCIVCQQPVGYSSRRKPGDEIRCKDHNSGLLTKGHKRNGYAEDNIKFKGGWVNVWGYRERRVLLNGKNTRVLEHRYVMEQHLGTKLTYWTDVHHIDGNKTNNQIDNLQLLSKSEHTKLHNSVRGQRVKTI